MTDLAGISEIPNANIFVIGDVMLDRYYLGGTDRISPEAPVPVVRVARTEYRAGGAANVALNVARLGGQVSLFGLHGKDPDGQLLTDLLGQEKIALKLIAGDGLRTISKSRIISRQQQIVRLDMDEDLGREGPQTLLRSFEDLVGGCNSVIVSDYGKGTLGEVSKIITAARKAGKWVLVDPKGEDFSIYSGANIITPNFAEFCAAGGEVATEEVMLASARAMLDECGIDYMLLTRGGEGMTLIGQEENHHFPALTLEVSDVTGAGDTVIATFATMIGAGFELPDAARLANIAAGIVVGKLGAATVTAEDLARRAGRNELGGFMDLHPTVEQTLQQIDRAREAGRRIVFTNGCFDILHAGHVRYLNAARALGHRLVVGLNTDGSVRRLKGDGRPVNSLEDRLEVLSGLACVDWVVPFGDDPDESDTPERLIRRVQPDMLVKGADHTLDTIVGADFVRRNGGEVVAIPLLPGRSTTALIDSFRG